ncbi:hypothetical protein HJC23_003774 [Cyclotella cryptica]|uniref:Uncharacterized protein n=1 Tax=Cyclotella cryptica TaxID=29204 RepID=A0ABD3QU11_9STRA
MQISIRNFDGIPTHLFSTLSHRLLFTRKVGSSEDDSIFTHCCLSRGSAFPKIPRKSCFDSSHFGKTKKLSPIFRSDIIG